MYKILTVGEQKEVKWFSELLLLDVRKTPQVEGLERFPYLVFIQGGEQAYQFDPETDKFYMDVRNNEAMLKQQEEHLALTKELEAEGKTDEEIKQELAGKGTIFFDRVECTILSNVNVAEKVQEYIKYI